MCIQSNVFYRPPLHNDQLSTTVTFFCPGGQTIHCLLFESLYNGNGHKSVSPTAKITSQQQPVFSATDEKPRMVMIFDPYGLWMINRGKPSHNGNLFTEATFVCPQGGRLWRGSTVLTLANRPISIPCSIGLTLSYRGTTKNKSWVTAECDNIRIYRQITRYRAIHGR